MNLRDEDSFVVIPRGSVRAIINALERELEAEEPEGNAASAG
jgi:hypothetical protein